MGEAKQGIAGPGDRPLELPQRGALDAIRARPCLQHRLHVLLFVGARERDDADRRAELAQPAGGFDAVHHGHCDIHDHHIGRQLDRERNSVAACNCLTDHLDLGMDG